jgi:uncharacterized protein (DUF2345 family)
MSIRDTALAVPSDQLWEALSDIEGVHIATIVSLSPDGTPGVRLVAGSPAVSARLAVAATRQRIETAIAQQQQAVVVFERGDRTKPIIIGLIAALEEPAVTGQPEESQQPHIIEADVDGKRVRVTAQDEIVLQCGSASITLRRNGRVVVRGTYVETHSDGTNRIKGGQVQIN